MEVVHFFYYCPECGALLAISLPARRYSEYECPYCGWRGLDVELVPECDVDIEFDE